MVVETRLPRYKDLPIDPSKPPRSAWGVFGEDDQVGTMNLLTPERVRRRLAGHARADLLPQLGDGKADPPILGRKAMHHHIIDLTPGTDDSEWGTDDYYDGYWPQSSTQWDALSHMPHPEFGYYNGVQRAEITGEPGTKNGIENWARRGIAGRFVLADVAAYLREQGRPIDASKRVAIAIADVQAALDAQGGKLLGGDVLLLRMGWIEWYNAAPMDTRVAISKAGWPRAAGARPLRRRKHARVALGPPGGRRGVRRSGARSHALHADGCGLSAFPHHSLAGHGRGRDVRPRCLGGRLRRRRRLRRAVYRRATQQGRAAPARPATPWR